MILSGKILLRSMLRTLLRTKNMKKYIRKATRAGRRSISVVIPAEIVKQLKIREKQKLTISTKGPNIIIKDWK